MKGQILENKKTRKMQQVKEEYQVFMLYSSDILALNRYTGFAVKERNKATLSAYR